MKELQDFLQKNDVEFLTQPAEKQVEAAGQEQEEKKEKEEEEKGEGEKEGAKTGRIISLSWTHHPAVTGPASRLPCRGG